MMMKPETWRKLIKPHLRRVFDVGKAKGLWVAYHCCGALRPIIGDLVEIGMDVLNPVQCNCPGMDPLELKKEFGKQLAFMGGVDTQGVLPSGTVDEVRRATAGLIEGMTADGGGFILAASHTVPPETPDENIFAMYAEAGISREEIFDCAAGIRASGNAYSYILWLFFLIPLPLLSLTLLTRPKAFKVQFRLRWKAGFLGGICTAGSYGLALWAMTVAPIALVAGLRETSVIFGTVFACLFLKERFGVARYAAAVLLTAGGVAIKVF
jgi:uncharacterized membrane protein